MVQIKIIPKVMLTSSPIKSRGIGTALSPGDSNGLVYPSALMSSSLPSNRSDLEMVGWKVLQPMDVLDVRMDRTNHI